jgi:hypothetical protein
VDVHHIRHVAAVLAGLACACLGLAVTAAPAFAQVLGSPRYADMPAALVREALLNGEDLPAMARPGSVPSPGVLTVTRTIVVGGMPGWQIVLIAVGAATLGATLAVRADRARAARGRVLATQQRVDGLQEPPGSVVDLGQTAEDGVTRDLLEETGIRMPSEWLTGVYKNLRSAVERSTGRDRTTT